MMKDKLRTYFESAPGGIVVADNLGNYIDLNPRFCEMTGYSRVELLQMSFRDLVFKEDAALAAEQLRTIGDLGRAAGVIRHVRKDGEIRSWQVESVRLEDSTLLGFLSDVTDTVAMQHRLAHADERYATLFENMNNAHALHEIVLDDSGTPVDYIFMEVNKAFEAFTGLKRENILGKRVTEVIPGIEKDDADWIGFYGKVATTGQTANIKQYSEALDQWYLVTAYCPGEGQFVAQFNNITEQKRLENRLLQADKMKAIGQLAGGVAHDFNNQLAGIIGYADLLQSELAENPELSSYVKSILTAAERSADLTSQLLAFGRVGRILNVQVDIHEIIDEVIHLLSRSLDKRIRIVEELNAGVHTVIGDPTQLQSAILNLALNAGDAMKEGGDLTFATSITNLDKQDCEENTFAISPGTYLMLSVRDTGTGISKELQQKIFEPFFTTKEPGKGTGLGLAAVDGTVKDHSGAISVYSELTEGTEFKIYLPLDTEGQKELKRASVEVDAARKATIMVVDDEEMIREVLSSILVVLGYEVVCCADGMEAVAYFEKHFKKIDLVILDMVMPKMSGRDTFFQLKKINQKVRVILSSGFSLNHDAQDLLDLGVRDFLQKPYRKVNVANKVASIIADRG